jgi:phage anti-repressor protein
MHTPLSKGGQGEKPVAIGIMREEKEEIVLTRYLKHVENCREKGHWCEGCRYAKIYILTMEDGKLKGWEERNGKSKEMRRYKWKLERGGVCTPEELEERLLNLGFYVSSSH